MRNTNSPGHVAPSLKSINVECNLLETWLAERIALQRALMKRFGLFLTSLLLLTVLTPPLVITLRAERSKSAVAARVRNGLAAQKKMWEDRRKSVDPEVAGELMRKKSDRKVSLMVGWTVDTLNLAPPQVVIQSCHSEVLGGELVIRVRADASTSEVAQSYVEAAGKDPRVTSSLLATSRRSSALGPKGVAFEFVRKIQVTT